MCRLLSQEISVIQRTEDDALEFMEASPRVAGSF